MDEMFLKRQLANNPDLNVSTKGTDPRFVASVIPKEKREEVLGFIGYDMRGPESPLEELLLYYISADPELPPPSHWGYEFAHEIGRKWRADAVYLEEKIMIEVDGGIHGVGKACPECGRRANGGHNSGSGFTNDSEKRNYAQIIGFIVLSFTRGHMESGYAVETIRAALDARRGNDNE